MNKKSFLELISSKKPILSDGAMGTLLHERGISFEKCFDELNLTNPSVVGNVHHEYIEAGAQIILSNTFGANSYKLGKHGLKGKLKEINTAGVDLARRTVMASFKDILIAGDVGPLGVRLAPFGRVLPEEAQRIFSEQIRVLLDADVDLLIFETMTDLFEIREAIYATKTLSTDIPIVASMTFTRDDRTLLGDNPRKVAKDLKSFGADVIGINCSGGPNQLLRILKDMRSALPDGKFWVKPNAGWPEQMGGRIFYPASPDYFGDYAKSFWKSGADVIGGCCGTTPGHIASMRASLDSVEDIASNGFSLEIIDDPAKEVEKTKPTRLSKKLNNKKFVFAVEMDPPRGLSTNKLMAGASMMADAGADVIDVADSPRARMRMSPWAVCSLVQRKAKIETVLHFPTRGRNLLRLQGDLLAAHALDVRNIFVVMGDPTEIGDYPEAMDDFDLAPSGLVKLIKQGFNTGVDHSGTDIGQPTSFFAGCALNLAASDPKRQLKIIRRKIKAGADFVLTQPIYSIEPLENFYTLYQESFGAFPIPILAGILPLASDRHAAFLDQEVPGIHIPEDMHTRMRKAGDQGAKEGIRIATDLIGKIKEHAQGIYLMPAFNRFDYAAEIIETCTD
jgi:methionine synthase / methylenetetrahydrofolate reductase(NADPH)